MKIQGSCEIDCPVVRLMRGETEIDTLSLIQGCSAEDLVASQQAEANIIEACKQGGPSKPILSFGRLACNSAVVKMSELQNKSLAAAYLRSTL
jgi:hypothetical protein